MAYSLLLAFSLSIDALGIGISYGMRKIKFPLPSALLLAGETFVLIYLFMLLGHGLSWLIPADISVFFANGFLFCFGFWLCLQGFRHVPEASSILHQPSSCDLDQSKTLDPKEALLLGLVLSLDSFGVGVSASVSGMNVSFLPILTGMFQTVFLAVGAGVGKHFSTRTHIKENTWTILSGTLLIGLSLSRGIF